MTSKTAEALTKLIAEIVRSEMNARENLTAPTAPGHSFDLFRLSTSKKTVDLSPNTLREYNRRGLAFYRQGKCVFVSKSELAHFIRTNAS